MATATTTERSAAQVVDPSGPGPADPTIVAPEVRGEYRCECGHVLRVFGGGRHRVYFEVANATLDDPVMDRACPQCRRGLPGKNRP